MSDYERILSAIRSLGMAKEPALVGTAFSVEDISCENSKCPLGLYDPNTNTITIPPGFYDSVLVHEIGHRFGHYYYNDLSEAFAERFRMEHTPGAVLVAAGSAAEFRNLDRYEALFKEGARGRVEIAFCRPITRDDLIPVRDMLSKHPQLCAAYQGNILAIDFRKGIPFLPIILGLGMIITAGFVGFGLFRVTESVADKLIPLSLIAGGFLIIYSMTSRR